MSEHLGNDHNLLCPKCKRGDQLSVAALVWAKLRPDGTDNDDSDTEWDDNSGAACKCGWHGHVSGFIKLPEGEGKMVACQDCEFEWYENQCDDVKDAHERFTPGDVYTDLQCPSCGALCYPI